MILSERADIVLAVWTLVEQRTLSFYLSLYCSGLLSAENISLSLKAFCSENSLFPEQKRKNILIDPK